MTGIVIIGAGEAGVRAAIGLREAGWSGSLALIGDEPHLPYERPPLSKASLMGESEPPPPAIADWGRLAELGVERVAGLRVTAIDRPGHKLNTGEGREIPYDRLLLATGARARRLSLTGGERALVLRGHDDALALRQQLKPGRRIAVIGGGFIGLELAAAARERGCSVIVFEAAPRLLMRGVPAELATVIAARHQAAGVEIVTGCAITEIASGDGAFRVMLGDGRFFIVDCVVAGIGAAPEIELAAAAGLAIDNGLAADGKLRTSDPDIFAAGDCCSFPHGLYDGRRVRLEAWRNARDQGAFVARSMLGDVEDYCATPWFWSDQYDLHLQISGLVDAGASVVTRDLGGGARLNFHLDARGRLVAASALGSIGKVGKDARIAEMLVAQRASPDPEHLAAGDRKLKALLAA
jgi:3-phenylpropionate/trans-cinnamate dioxygenase ferredoxin reductase subunit